MTRRPIRLAVPTLCALSLLASLGTGWLWWRSYRVEGDYLEAAAGGVYVIAASSRDDLSVIAVGRWPGRALFRASSVAKPADLPDWYGVVATPDPAGRRAWEWRGRGAAAGTMRVAVDPDGTPIEGPFRLRFALPLLPTIARPYWSIGNLPHGSVVAATALPPLMWAGARVRRLLVRRRRRRLGLCLACGYDLRGNPGSGRCPECGTPAANRAA